MAVCPTIDPNNPPLTPIAPAIRFLKGKAWDPNWRCPGAKTGPANHDEYSRCLDGLAGLVVTWPEFLEQAKTAPGGNKYFSKIVDFNAVTYKANTNGVHNAVWMASQVSKRMFAAYFGPGKEHGKMLMKDVLTKYKDELVPTLGILSVEVTPKPTERADAYVKRGGYLFWIGGWKNYGSSTGGATGDGAGVFGRYVGDGITTGTHKIQGGTFEWQPDNVDNFELYLAFDWKRGRLKYVIRLDYEGAWDKAVDKIQAAIEWLKNSFCKALTNQALSAGAAYAATNPTGAAAYASWQLAAALCGKTLPTCDAPIVPAYPAGTIVHFDKKKGGYLVATPRTGLSGLSGLSGLNGLEPSHIATGTVEPAVPAGAAVVGTIAWQNATQNWYERPWVQGVAGGVILLGGVAVVLKRRRSATVAA